MAWPRRTLTSAAVASGMVALIVVGVLAWARPRLFPSPFEKARAAYERREWSRAEGLTRDLLKRNPSDRDALRLLAWTSGRMGRDETVRAIYAKLGPETPGAEDCLILAAGSHRRGDSRSAIRFIEKGLGLDPNHADLLHFLITYDTSMDRLDRRRNSPRAWPGCRGRGLGVTCCWVASAIACPIRSAPPRPSSVPYGSTRPSKGSTPTLARLASFSHATT